MTIFHCLSGATLCLHSLDIFLTLYSDSREYADRVVLDLLQHDTEHFERFALVFLLRVFLGIATKMNSLPKIIHAGEMFFPVVIELHQH